MTPEKKKLFIIVGIAALFGIIGLVIIFTRTSEPPEKVIERQIESPGIEGEFNATDQAPEDVVQPEVEYKQQVQPQDKNQTIEQLLPLDASDATVKERVSQLTSHPQVHDWLMVDGLVPRFVAAVDNISRGRSPFQLFPYLQPAKPFEPVQVSGDIHLAEDIFDRYDLIIKVFTSLDTEKSGALYRRLYPFFNRTYHEQGYPEAEFQDTFIKAVSELLKTPVPDGQIYLKKKVLTYTYLDPQLENLTEAQKHLLRMGPDNMRRFQEKLRNIALAIGISEEDLPEPREVSPKVPEPESQTGKDGAE